MVLFERLRPKEVSPELMNLIDQSKFYDDRREDTELIWKDVVSNHVQVWHFQNETKHGIMLTRVITRDDNQELQVFIWRVFGEGMIRAFAFIEDVLLRFAEQVGATSLGAITTPGLARLMQGHGFKPAGKKMIKEIQ